MTEILLQPSSVVRTERGLSIAGTRITLYDVLGYLKQEWAPHLIQYWLNLSDQQMNDVLSYIEANRAEVEAEYELVLKEAEESQRYWNARNRHLFSQLETRPVKPGQEKIKAKLQARKNKLVHLGVSKTVNQ